VAGTTGEGPVLTDEERIALFRAVVEAVDVPVIASTGTNDTAHSVMLTNEAKASGAAGVLVVTPYYNRPSPAGLAAHFRAVASTTDLPVVLYDIPIRSGRRIGSRLTIELAREVPSIVAVKDATGDVAAAAIVVAGTPEDFDVYCGDDSLTLPFAAIGGAGVISVAAHWAGSLFGEMVDRYREDWSALWWVRVDGVAQVLRPGAGGDPGDEGSRTALDLLAAKYPQYRDRPPPGPVVAIDIVTWRAWP